MQVVCELDGPHRYPSDNDMNKALFLTLLAAFAAPLHAEGLKIGLPHSNADADFAAAQALALDDDVIIQGSAACITEILCHAQTRSGALDVTVTGPLVATGLLPASDAFDMPYFLTSQNLRQKLPQLPVMQADGVEMFAVTPDGSLRVIATTSRRITHPEDLAGLQIYAPDLPSELLVLAAGGEPVDLPPSTLFDALQIGQLDGAILDLSDLMSRNLLMAGVSYATIADHAVKARLWWTRPEYLAGRDMKSLRAAMVDSALRSGTERNEEAQRDFADGGGDLYRLTEPERAAFRIALAGFRAAMRRQAPETAEIDALLAVK